MERDASVPDDALRILLDGARRDLSETDSRADPEGGLRLVVARRRDGCPAVAFLATWDAIEPLGFHLVLPLKAGLNRLGRDRASDHELPPLPCPIMEQGQWLIECRPEPPSALVRDGWSTNLSAVVRAVTPLPDDPRAPLLVDFRPRSHRVEIEHANLKPDPVPLLEGDTLVGAWASFVFGCLGERR
jgi:hypothetical protein